jgi:hypothetical protein
MSSICLNNYLCMHNLVHIEQHCAEITPILFKKTCLVIISERKSRGCSANLGAVKTTGVDPREQAGDLFPPPKSWSLK